jgi:hypothetical protein
MFSTEPRHTSTHNISKTEVKSSCRFYRITDLGILHFYFSSKNCSSKVHTYLDKVVVLVILSTAKLSLLFLDFSMIFNRFYKVQPTHEKGIESFYS